jgi:4,5-dihydroxyphthalate decarboxylase
MDGTIKVQGCTIIPVAMQSEELFPRVVSRADFDITEMSLSSYLVQLSRNEGEYIALPIFPSRGFRHSGIYIRADAGINEPADLEDRLVGIPEYQMTFGLWIRGILADQHGVDTNRIRYRTGGTNQTGRVERLSLEIPASLDVLPLAADMTLSAALAEGDLDAVLSPTPPKCFTDGDPHIRRLFPNSGAAERGYFSTTGFFPIMHVMGIRKDLAARHPVIVDRIYEAFCEAKRDAFDELAWKMRASVPYISIPWIADDWAETIELMGADYWPYGIDSNRSQLDAICRYSTQQHLSRRKLSIDDLFAPITSTRT